MYILNKRMRVNGEFREPGDPIPEAADWSWQIRECYLRNGHIHVVPDEPDTIPAKTSKLNPSPRKAGSHAHSAIS